MRKSLTLLLLSALSSTVHSQCITALRDSGTSFAREGVLLDGERCTFSRNDGKTAEWAIEIETTNGVHVLKRSHGTLDIELDVTPAYKEWSDYHPARYVVGDDVYWKCHVMCKDYSGIECDLPFYLLVLPSTPRIIGIDALYDGFDDKVPAFLNARLSFELESRRAKLVMVNCQYESESKWENDPSVTVDYFGEQSPVLKTGYREWDAWERYYIYASNSYGISESSDTVYITNLITDPDIRSALGLERTGIQAYKVNEPNIAVKGKEVTLGSNIELVGMYSLQGYPVTYRKDGNTVRIQNTVKGVVLAIFRINSLTITKKIEL